MKCPKCGYNSFESNDACPKCSADVTAFKNSYGIAPLVFPEAVRSIMSKDIMTSLQGESHAEEADDQSGDIFSFDDVDDSSVDGATAALDDPFNFDEPASDPPTFSSPPTAPPLAAPIQQAPEENDPFADLLESNSQENDPFADLVSPSSQQAVSAPQPQEQSSSPGEFDLNSFSWDDSESSATTEQPEAKQPEISDDFDSLFNDLDISKDK